MHYLLYGMVFTIYFFPSQSETLAMSHSLYGKDNLRPGHGDQAFLIPEPAEPRIGMKEQDCVNNRLFHQHDRTQTNAEGNQLGTSALWEERKPSWMAPVCP